MNPNQPVQTSGLQFVPLTAALLPRVQAAAAADGNHATIHPTHVALRGDEVVGAGSLGRVRLFLPWLHSTRLRPAEVFDLWRRAEAEMKRQRGPIALPCVPGSPLRRYVERMGYQDYGDVRLYLKD